MVNPVFPVNKVSLAKTDPQDLRDHKVPLEIKDHRENQAKASLEKRESL